MKHYQQNTARRHRPPLAYYLTPLHTPSHPFDDGNGRVTRELADLVQKNCLAKLPGGGRSTRYALAIALATNASTL